MDLYHVLNRGVDKRDIVLDEEDRARFLHDLFIFNDKHAAPNYILANRHLEHPRKLLVHIHAFCLMQNHYHLLLSPAIENGISGFMKKLNMGYTKYFNEKYKRSGTLWQGKHKKILIERHAHFLFIPYYIHLNPLDAVMPEWREGGIKNVSKAIEFLAGYRWSSHLDYIGLRNFPSITEREFLLESMGGRQKYQKEIRFILTSPESASGSGAIE